MHGQNVRPEKEQKEAEYRESWPCFARTLRDRSVFFDKQSHSGPVYKHIKVNELFDKLPKAEALDLQTCMSATMAKLVSAFLK